MGHPPSEGLELGAEGGAFAADAIIMNALYEEYKAIRNGECTPEIRDPNQQ